MQVINGREKLKFPELGNMGILENNLKREQ